MRDFLIISLGAVFGANARYVFSRFTAKMIGPAFPYGTLIINVVGSAIVRQIEKLRDSPDLVKHIGEFARWLIAPAG